MDAFKRGASAWDACQAAEAGLREALPELQITIRPMADGGEGTARELMTALKGRWIPEEVAGPYPDRRVESGYVWFAKTKTALVEMASANGLELLDPSRMNPLLTSSYGTGQLIKAAEARGAKKILLAVGGSATVDGGVGMAMALGWKFNDESGKSVGFGGQALERIRSIDGTSRKKLPRITVLCDVQNPLYGTIGAARVFGPQKGATPEMVEVLERGMVNLAKLATIHTNKVLHPFPGAGAAGGLAAGAYAFLDAELSSGIDRIAELLGLEALIKDADYVLTGEGCFDEQSLNGKVVSGVCALAAPLGVPVGVIAGRVRVPPFRFRQFGIRAAKACTPDAMSTPDALKQTVPLIREAARLFALEFFNSGSTTSDE